MNYTNYFKSEVWPEKNFLFLGNYINRGIKSVETILLLILLKINIKPFNKFIYEKNIELFVRSNDLIMKILIFI